MGMILGMGVVTFINFILLKIKVEDGRWADAALDALSMFVLAYLFGGTIMGMLVAMTAGMLISIYLLFFPPEFMSGLGSDSY